MQENNSQNAILILKKLKKSLKITTDIELSEILNVKPNTISTWKKRNTLDYRLIISVCELYEIDLNLIFAESYSAVTNNNFSDSLTPLVSKEQQFQYCIDKEDVIETLPRYHFPFIKTEGSVLFQVSSNNMFPIIEENSFAICEIAKIETIKDNSLVVVISKSKGFFINRIIKSTSIPEMYTLVNENKFFNNIGIFSKDIDEIWSVKGILSFNINNCPSSSETIVNDDVDISKKSKIAKA